MRSGKSLEGVPLSAWTVFNFEGFSSGCSGSLDAVN